MSINVSSVQTCFIWWYSLSLITWPALAYTQCGLGIPRRKMIENGALKMLSFRCTTDKMRINCFIRKNERVVGPPAFYRLRHLSYTTLKADELCFSTVISRSVIEPEQWSLCQNHTWFYCSDAWKLKDTCCLLLCMYIMQYVVLCGSFYVHHVTVLLQFQLIYLT